MTILIMLMDGSYVNYSYAFFLTSVKVQTSFDSFLEFHPHTNSQTDASRAQAVSLCPQV